MSLAATVPPVPSSTVAQPASRGFTLIELVIVIVVLSVLAGLVIPQMSGVEAESRIAVTVSNMGDVTRTMNAFNAMSKGKYPDGWDSLLDATNTANIYPGNGVPTQNSGVFATWLISSPIATTELASLRRVSSNVVATGPTGSLWTVYDHSPTVANPLRTTDNATPRVLDDGVPANAPCAFVNAAVPQGQAVYRSFNLDPTDTTYRLLALGIGPRCTLIGNKYAKLTEVPVSDDVTPNNSVSYRRFVALFKVFTATAPGAPFAQYVGVTTSYGKNHTVLRDFQTL